MDLNQIYYKPADVVRDRKTNTDYVIESVAGVSIAGGLYITAIGLFTDRIENWRVYSEQEMKDNHLLIVKGSSNADPVKVRHYFRDQLAKATKNSEDVLNEILEPKNQALYDLLIATISDETPGEKVISKSIINLTESLMSLTGEIPDKVAVAKALRENFPNLSSETVDAFAENVATYGKSRKIANKLLSTASTLNNLLAPDSVAFKLAKGVGVRYTDTPDHPLFKQGDLRRILLGTNRDFDTELLGVNSNLTGADRISEIAHRLFNIKNGTSETDSTIRSIIDQNHAVAAKQFLQGKLNPNNPNAEGGKLLLDAITNYLVDPATAHGKHLRSQAKNYARHDKGTDNLFKAQYAEEAEQVFRTQEHKRVTTRRSSIKTKSGNKHALRLFDRSRIREAATKPGTDIFAISTDAFFTSIVGNQKVKIDKFEGSVRDPAIQKALEEYKVGQDPYLIVTAQELREYDSRVARAGESAAIDITNVLKEQAERSQALHAATKQQLGETMINLSLDTGTKAIVPLKEIEQQDIYQVTNGPEDVFITSDLDKVERALKPDSEVSVINFGKQSFGLVTELINEEEAIEGFIPRSGGLYSKVMREALKKTTTVYSMKDQTVDSLIKILRRRQQGDLYKLLGLGKKAGADFLAASEKGSFDGRMAIANLRGKTVALATETATEVETQATRATEFLDGRGVILDIETRKSNTGKDILTQVSFGTENDIANYHYPDFKSSEARAKSMFKIASQLQSHIVNGKDIIATAGPHDLDSLIRITQDLIDELSLEDGTKEGMKRELEEALEIFKRVRSNHHLDLQVLHQLGGDLAGNTSQAYLTSTYLNRVQKHTAKQDVLDAWEIVRLNAEKIKEGAKTSAFDRHITDDYYYTGNNPMFTESFGKIKKLIGTSTTTNADGKQEFHLHHQLYEVETVDGVSKLKPANIVGSDTYASPMVAASVLENNSTVFRADQLNEVLSSETIAAKYKRANEEYIGRRVRAYNPFQASRYDSLARWKNNYGNYGAANMVHDAYAAQLLPEVQLLLDKEAQRLLATTRGRTELNTTQQIALMDKAYSFIEQVMENHNIGNEGDDARKYVGERLYEAIDGGIVKDMYLNPDSLLHKRLNSPAGKRLLDSAKSHLGYPVDEARDYDEFEFTNRYAFYTDAAAKKQTVKMATAARVMDMYTETVPRLSLKLGEQATSFELDKVRGLADNDLLQKIQQLSATVMLDDVSKSAPLQQALEALNMGHEEYNKLVDSWALSNSLGDRKANIEEWKKAIQGIGWGATDDNLDEYKELQKVRAQLQKRNTKSIIIGAVKEKHDNLMALFDIERDEETKMKLHQKALEMKKLAAELHDTLRNPARAHIDAAKIFNRIFGEGDTIDAFNDYFLKDGLEDLTDEELDTADAERIKVMTAIREKLDETYWDSNTEADIQDVAQEAHRKALPKSGLPTTNYEHSSAAANKLRDIAELSEQGNKAQNTMAQSQNTMDKARAADASRAARAAGAATADQAQDIRHQTHRTVSDIGPSLRSVSKAISKTTMPILALGGLVGLLAAKEPNTGPAFKQGYASDNLEGMVPNSHAIAQFSEVPGDPDNQQVWYGSTAPFQLDMTFRGFVDDRIAHERLQRDVFNIINSNMEVRRNFGSIQDNRNKQHRLSAIESLRDQGF